MSCRCWGVNRFVFITPSHHPHGSDHQGVPPISPSAIEGSSGPARLYNLNHPGVINYQASGSDCRLRLPRMQSDRHPDQAIYLDPPPEGRRLWARWVPHIVVEIVSAGGEERDYVEKREEYLRAGVRE